MFLSFAPSQNTHHEYLDQIAKKNTFSTNYLHLSLILLKWILRCDCFSWSDYCDWFFFRIKIKYVNFFVLWPENLFSHSFLFHFQKNFRVVKTHFISCTDAFKAYQFSVITVQKLAKPDKLPKIVRFLWCIMITIHFCLSNTYIFTKNLNLKLTCYSYEYFLASDEVPIIFKLNPCSHFVFN